MVSMPDLKFIGFAIPRGCWPLMLGLLVGCLVTQRSSASPDRAEELTRTTLQLEGNSGRGATLYKAQCAACHGSQAWGDAAKLIPALAGQRRAYLIKQFADFAELDRDATQMHVVVSRVEVSEPQAWADLALYLNAQPPLKKPQAGNGEHVSLGEASYQQWCASCHEADARGDDDGFVPALRNQHYAYLLLEMRSLAGGHRFNVEPELVLMLDSLKADELAGMADYLSRLRGKVRDRARLMDDGSVSH